MAQRVLVVDDERSIRLTISQALSPLKLHVDEAGDGEEALQCIARGDYDLVLLDLRLLGMDGIEVLRRMRQAGSSATVLVVTAYGTVDNAVEAMKLGAVDFVQKPFSPDEIRSIVMGALNRRDAARESDQAPDYDECLDRARAEIGQTRLEDAGSWVRRALALDPSRPDAPNLLGALEEMAGHPAQAQKYYRAAVELDAKYRAAWANLERSTTMGGPRGKIDLGDSQRRHR